MAQRGDKWSQDEIRVLCAIYFNSEFSIGDDDQEECRLIADCFGRSAGSIDRQWRNIAAIVNSSNFSNVGKLLQEGVHQYLEDPRTAVDLASVIIERHGWPLENLLRQGSDKSAFADATESNAAQVLRNWLLEQIAAIDYEIFPGGSHGYLLEIDNGEVHGQRFRVRVSSVLAGSNRSDAVAMATSRDEIIQELTSVIKGVSVRKSITGKLAIYSSSSTIVRGERFKLAIQANELQGSSK